MTSKTCPECGRVFDLTNETDAEEWQYGHDCEAPSAMSIEARELELYLMNDEPTYRRFFLPVENNLKRKLAEGTFDRDRAVQGFMHTATGAAKNYHHAFGTATSLWHHTFTPLCRREVAESLVDSFLADHEVTHVGDCFVVAATLVTHDADLELCHGSVWHPETGVHAHAWVEQTLTMKFPTAPDEFVDVQTIVCIDKSNGNDITMPRAVYYKFGRIEETAVKRYSTAEAIWHMCNSEHYGPWS